MASLEDLLQKYTITIFKKSNRFASLGTIKWRVLQYCAECLNIDLKSYIDENLILVHGENMSLLDRKWQSLMDTGTKFSHYEKNIYKIIKFSDYLNILDVQLFLKLLEKKNQTTFVNEILSLDGFKGFEIKNYLQNLQYRNEMNHIFIIREIYKNMNVSPKIVHLALLHVYEKFDKKYIQPKIERLKKEITYNQQALKIIMDYYNENIKCNLEEIAIIKIDELKSYYKRKIHKHLKRSYSAQKKNKPSKKHILKQDHKEKSSKILKVKFLKNEKINK